MESGRNRRSINRAAKDVRDLPYFANELLEFFGQDRLRSVGQGVIGIVMNLDKQAIRSDCH